MYGSRLDFSDVSLPGVGGSINASNAVSMERLKEMNASGKKWSPDITGGMSHHNESILKMNAANREKRANLVNREYNENCDGNRAMKEIFDRKKSRMSSFKEMKRSEYGFSEGDSQDTELLSMPQPFAMAECKCGGSCALCREKKRKEIEYREWSTKKREKLKEGEVKGEFAGPNMSFPISSPEDVAAAWSSVGRARNPRQIMASIIRIAKKHGWESGLPQTVKDRLNAGESGLPE
jgi:hypothetical protein